MKFTDIVTYLGVLIAIASAIFTFFQARAAKRSIQQAHLAKFFGSLDMASQTTIINPDILYSVHGLSKDIPIEEARNIAYLSMLLDSFQHFYGEHYENNFEKMTEDMKKQSTFLNRVLTVEENVKRWGIIKNLYYGDFDTGFIAAIDELIKYGRHKA